jgi:hypothetical protein
VQHSSIWGARNASTTMLVQLGRSRLLVTGPQQPGMQLTLTKTTQHDVPGRVRSPDCQEPGLSHPQQEPSSTLAQLAPSGQPVSPLQNQQESSGNVHGVLSLPACLPASQTCSSTCDRNSTEHEARHSLLGCSKGPGHPQTQHSSGAAQRQQFCNNCNWKHCYRVSMQHQLKAATST